MSGNVFIHSYNHGVFSTPKQRKAALFVVFSFMSIYLRIPFTFIQGYIVLTLLST